MKKEKHLYRVGLRGKLIVSFIISVFLAFLLVGYGSYYYVSRVMGEDVSNLAKISASQINKNVDTYIDELYRLTNMTLSDEEFQQILKNSNKEKGFQEKAADTESIMRFLFNIYIFRPDLYSVCLQTTSGEIYTQGFNRYVGSFYDIHNESWYEMMAAQPASSMYVVGHRTSSQIMDSPGEREVFTVARSILDDKGNSLGFCIIDTKYESFRKIFAELEAEQSAQIFLLNQSEEIIYDSREHLSGGAAQGKHLDSFDEIDTKRYFKIIDQSKNTGWKVVVAIPKTQAFGNLRGMYQSILLLMFICAAFSIFLYTVMSYAITKPIQTLTAAMRRAETGDFSITLVPNSQDEIGELGNGFNHMLGKINQLLAKMVGFEIREKESEYKMLQSQINPHFLYNTLEAIRMKCVIQKEMEIAGLINTLSNLFRLSIDRHERFATVKDELDHVTSYMTIQNFRFDNKYKLKIQVDENLLDYKILKLMLQPLVENCVFHGLEMKLEGGHIDIVVQKCDTELIVTISDDGMGINPAALDELNQFLQNPNGSHDRRSVGLRNVHERIRLLFGDAYGLTIWSKENVGTIITIHMPAFQQEEEVDFYA